jgi:hypothetical protein
MPREKMPYRALCDYVGSVTWVDPIRDDTEPVWHGKVPAMEAVMPDGRKVYVSFEHTFSAPTDRDKYISRMRKMAATLNAAADRAEREGNMK